MIREVHKQRGQPPASIFKQPPLIAERALESDGRLQQTVHAESRAGNQAAGAAFLAALRMRATVSLI